MSPDGKFPKLWAVGGEVGREKLEEREIWKMPEGREYLRKRGSSWREGVVLKVTCSLDRSSLVGVGVGDRRVSNSPSLLPPAQERLGEVTMAFGES